MSEETKQEEVVEESATKEPTEYGFKIKSVANKQARTVNLGNFNSVKLNAEIEIVFDEPQNPDSQIVKDAFTKMRELNKAEWYQQMAPYRSRKDTGAKEEPKKVEGEKENGKE